MNHMNWVFRFSHAHGLVAAVALLSITDPLAAQQKHKAVVELFTSQGCPSCPQADAVLHKLSQRGDVIVLSLSVHYWDYIGWKDTLATPENARRQSDYARRKANGDNRVYTPQMVVNGMACAPAHAESKIDAVIEKTNETLKAVRVAISAYHEGATLIVEAGDAQNDVVSEATVWLARVSPNVDVSIQRGENAGKTVSYTNAVRALTPIGKWRGKTARYEIPPRALTPGDFYVALLQSDADGAILSAVEIERVENATSSVK